MNIEAVIDSNIHLDSTLLPQNIIDSLLSRLRVPNPARKIAEREMLRGAKRVPEYIELWHYNGNELFFPRGFVFEFEKILKDNDIELVWCREMIGLPWVHHTNKVVNLRDYQFKAVGEMQSMGSGIYKAPTGSGKTRVMLELIRMLKHKTIVLCEKTDIAKQWVDRANELGFESIGRIGGGIWEEDKDLIIALRQSVWAANDLSQKWYEMFGMVIVDECHHCSAETMFELVQRFPAYYRFGCSATPDSDPELFPIARAVIGPVVAESSPEEIGEHLIKPSIRVVETEFEFPYRPTERVGNKVIRNNYNSMMSKLEKDKDRILKVLLETVAEAYNGHNCIVISKRKKHLDNMITLLREKFCVQTLSKEMSFQYSGRLIHIDILTGDNSKEYIEIKNRMDNYVGGSILFSTLASEGTDIPRLDRLFLAYPGRKLRVYEQAIGRIMRPYPKKEDAIVYDFRDVNVSLLNSQFRERCQMYHKNGYRIDS